MVLFYFPKLFIVFLSSKFRIEVSLVQKALQTGIDEINQKNGVN